MTDDTHATQPTEDDQPPDSQVGATTDDDHSDGQADANAQATRVLALLEQALADAVDDTPDTTTMETGEGSDWYDLNGLRVTSDPDKFLVGEPTDQAYKGLPMLSDAPRKYVPQTVISYVPTELPGAVSPIDDAAKKLRRGIPAAYEGEAGTGKNTLFDELHARTNRPLYNSNIGLDTSIFQLVNEKDHISGVGTVNNLGDLAKAAVFGGTWLGNETNMAEGDITSHIHGITERPGKRILEIYGTDRTLTDLPDGVDWDAEKHLGHYIHPEFKAAGTMNPIQYASTKEMNNAFRGRFSVKELDYLGADKEAGLIASDVGVEKTVALDLVDCVNELRAMYRQNQLNTPFSYRQLYHTLVYYQDHSVTLADAAKAELVGYTQLQLDKEAVEDTIDDEL